MNASTPAPKQVANAASLALPAVALAADEASVRIGPYHFPRVLRPGPYTPRPASLSHVTLDQPTFDLLLFVSEAIHIGAPCLLEGPTAASKTSIIVLLAALTNHSLVRLNLHGQSTADDLLGRYVPNTGQFNFSPGDFLRCRRLLTPKTIAVLEAAHRESRPLSAVESLLVAAREGLPLNQWVFQEGPIPTAMRRGHWVVIDEMNLTESQVLECLNSVLEDEPSLHLPGQSIHFGPAADLPVHSEFRALATMNPAGYAGRSQLSPAFRSRWRMTKAATVPTEAEFRQMLFSAVFGEQPVVEFDGQKYQGIWPPLSAAPPYAALAQVPRMRELLERVATVHAQVVLHSQANDGKPATLGAHRRDCYAFTRRDLLTFLDLLGTGLLEAPSANLKSAAVGALRRVYLDRLDQNEDRRIVTDLLRAQGIDRQQWTFDSEAVMPGARHVQTTAPSSPWGCAAGDLHSPAEDAAHPASDENLRGPRWDRAA